MEELMYEMNPWWEASPKADGIFRENYLDLFKKNLNNRDVIFVTGLRRVGKTTIMYQLIQKLMDTNVDKTAILFFSFDEVSVKLSEILEKYKEIYNKNFRKDKIYIFLDEIQKYSGWENELKKYYDLYVHTIYTYLIPEIHHHPPS